MGFTGKTGHFSPVTLSSRLKSCDSYNEKGSAVCHALFDGLVGIKIKHFREGEQDPLNTSFLGMVKRHQIHTVYSFEIGS